MGERRGVELGNAVGLATGKGVGCGGSSCAPPRFKLRVTCGDGRPCIKGCTHGVDVKQKKALKSLKWADEVGLALNEVRSFTRGPNVEFGKRLESLGEGGLKGDRVEGKLEGSEFISGQEALLYEEVGRCKGSSLGKCSYKEVLLKQRRQGPSKAFNPLPGGGPLSLKLKGLGETRRKGRCYRCLASDHFVAACRDPVRCLACRKTGHRASHCKEARRKERGEVTCDFNPIMERENRRRGRVLSAKAYIPYTEEFLRRTELRRNAVLVDVV